MNREQWQQLLGGYATGNLTPEQHRALLEASLHDQELFDALAAEQPLRDLLGDPAARAQLLRAVEPRRGLWQRFWGPAGLAAAALAAAGIVVGVVVVRHHPAKVEVALVQPKPATAVPPTPAPAPAKPAPAPKPGRKPAPAALPKAEAKLAKVVSSGGAIETSPRNGPGSGGAIGAPAPAAAPPQPAVAPPPASGVAGGVVGGVIGGVMRSGEPASAPPPPPPPPPAGPAATADSVRSFRPEEAAGANLSRNTGMLSSRLGASNKMKARKAEAPRAPGIRYTVTVQTAAGAFADAAPGSALRPGDRVRLRVDPGEPGYLYVLQRESSGGWQLLANVRVSQPGPVLVPETGAIASSEPGTKSIYLVFSREPDEDLARLAPQALERLSPTTPGAEKTVVPVTLSYR